MALSPRFTIEFDCDFQYFTFHETTGAYSVSNTGGYGVPNIATGDVDSTQLIVKNVLTDVTFDTITTVTVSSTGVDIQFDLNDLLVDGEEVYTENLADGIYEFTYNVIDGATTYQYTVRQLILPDLNCSLCTALSRVIDPTCGCSKPQYISSWLEGFTRIKALEGSAICGSITQFEELYDKTQNYFTSLNCGC